MVTLHNERAVCPRERANGIKVYQPRLSTVVLSVADVTETVVTSSRQAFPCGDIAAWRAGVVVVEDPEIRELLYFVDGMKRAYICH
jgi:hypothetical protein